MKLQLVIDNRFSELQVNVCNSARDEETVKCYELLRSMFEENIIAFDEDDERIPVCVSDVIRIYAANRQVYLSTAENTYRLRERLYELEERLPANRFVRISNSELVNIKKIKRLDTNLAGTIHMYLAGDIDTYVSRRNVSKIKKALGL